MAIKHYYIEDNEIDPRRADRIKPVRSIQFNLMSDKNVHINIEQPDGNKLVRASVLVPLNEIKHAYQWLSDEPVTK